MAVTDFIAAIELGSTKITGIAGRKNADGSLQILAYASEYSSDCIRKGAIYNIDKTAQCLALVIKQLEKQLQASVKKIYVGIGGLSVKSVYNFVSKQLSENTKISQSLVDALMQENKDCPLVNQEILAIEPQEYKVGNSLLAAPVGVSADSIEGRYQNIVARHELKSNIKQSFRQAGYEIADYLLSPVAAANVILTNNEKRSGCALIDLGAETTTVSVYKGNILRHLAVIPLGGNNITKDICSLQIEEEDAEQLKLRYASAYTELEDDEEEHNEDCVLEGKCKVPANVLEDIVEARINEIITNVWNQIKLSNYGDKLMAGFVLTGGGANLPDIDKAFQRITKMEKIRIARKGEIAVVGVADLPEDGTQNTLVGLLSAGKENCCKVDPHKTKDIFEAQQEQEERDRLLEEQKKQAEEENRKRAEKVRQDQLQQLKDQQEQERQKKRLKECDSYLEEARRLKSKRSYKDALDMIQRAREMKIKEKREEIDALEEAVRKEKKESGWFGRFRDKILNEVWDDETSKK